ncbi:hypothetical protein GCM10020331_072740 [Ectobacillus funiculus]
MWQSTISELCLLNSFRLLSTKLFELLTRKKGVAVLTVPDDIPRFEVEAEARITSSLVVKQEILPSTENLQQAKEVFREC